MNAPERIRTSDLTVRSRVLYPAELPVHDPYDHLPSKGFLQVPRKIYTIFPDFLKQMPW